jgi:hypothetical protein
MLTMILLICATVCFVIKAFNLVGKIDWLALGLAFWVVSFVV